MATTLPTLATNLTNDSQPLHTVTSSCLTEPNRASIYAFTIAYALTFLVALAGNAEVIRNASRHGINGRRPFDKLIINMAVADTLDAFTGLPLNTVFLHFGLKWFPGPFGVFLCKAVYFCMNVSVAASVFTFTFIAVDRFRAIVLESKRPFSNTAVNLVIATVWFIASLLFAHDWLVLGVHEHRGGILLLPKPGVLRHSADKDRDDSYVPTDLRHPSASSRRSLLHHDQIFMEVENSWTAERDGSAKSSWTKEKNDKNFVNYFGSFCGLLAPSTRAALYQHFQRESVPVYPRTAGSGDHLARAC